jgi:hypothetical protein
MAAEEDGGASGEEDGDVAGSGAEDGSGEDSVDRRTSSAALPPPACARPATWVPTHPCTSGSGYPGDPLTKVWIRDNMDPLFGWPSVARFSWSTAKVALKGPGAVRVTWEVDSDEGEPALDAKQQRLSAFFSASSASRATPGRFFAKRGMEQVAGQSTCL